MTSRIETFTIGQHFSYDRQVTADDIAAFADVSGDHNPVHLNPEFAQGTFFRGVIAHGMLSAAFISKVLGTNLPGEGAIYLEQLLKFKAPVRPGDTVTVRVEIIDVNVAKQRIRLRTTCAVGDTLVLDGEALLWVPN